ncbi:MAG TPA: DUF2336 domain-containing protein [Caulobacteraceae bacterium]
MSETALRPDSEADVAEPMPERKNRSRTAILKRLADVVSLPASRVNAFERSVTADLLVEILRDADLEERVKVARRLATLNEIPNVLVRLILRDDIEVAAPLLKDNNSLNDCDLLDCVRASGEAHRLAVAGRRGISEVVVEALVEAGDIAVVEALLRNEQARFPHGAIQSVAMMTRLRPQISPLLLRRPELRPSHAYVLFWWVDGAARRTILQRFAVSREILQEAAADVFGLAAAEGWRDPLSRMALQFIERRQRDRAALARSRFASLEEAIGEAERAPSREMVEEIARLAGVKSMTAAKILADRGGEPMAILCKATGLPKSSLRSLWRATRRQEIMATGETSAALENVLQVFDMTAVDRAQTVLRYWNWALSSGLPPALLNAIQASEHEAVRTHADPELSVVPPISADAVT